MKYLVIKTRTGNLTLQPLIFFSTFTEFAMVIYKTKMGIVHTQCLLRIDEHFGWCLLYILLLCCA